MSDTPPPAREAPSLRIRIVFGEDAMLGPGKADLLERIRETGSIAAAGRTMEMSYKRAWMLVEEMNAAFREPLVAPTRGGAKGGGARLTGAGETVLANYRKLEEIMAEAGAARIGILRGMLREGPFREGPPHDGPPNDSPAYGGSPREGPHGESPPNDGPSRKGPSRKSPSRGGSP